ncbi:hypothetical protein [Rubellimicrobium arenae]|uniref:hypothetical protein n=1 Tax=Rubellimicrobium arenae TaxID=2817372 RepID=UPI001B3023F3|nr:hypothetical protein [Rubellimicrobium arenae]
MGRIRTIKPEFFKHEELFDAEEETGLPLRLAFAGLWTVADREGRFEWKVRSLKSDVLPYDKVDFSRVLDALATRGFLVRYRVDGREYGAIPGFKKHQVVNNRESASQIPPPPENSDPPKGSTRTSRVDDACPTRHDLAQGEGKGREGKGREEESSSPPLARARGGAEGEGASLGFDPDEILDEVREALGIRAPFPTYWQAVHAIPHLIRWVQDFGLRPEQIVPAVRRSQENYDSPPDGPKALDGVMQRLGRDLAQPSREERPPRRLALVKPPRDDAPTFDLAAEMDAAFAKVMGEGQ